MEKICRNGSTREGKIASRMEEQDSVTEIVYDASTSTRSNALRIKVDDRKKTIVKHFS